MTVFSSLGNLVRLKRMERDYNQHEFAQLMGWKTIDRLREIEGDFAQPDRDVLERVFEVLEFGHEERAAGLLLAGIPPTAAEETAIARQLAPDLDAWPVPAYLKDFRWHLVYVNAAALAFFRLDSDNFVLRQRENILKLLLDPDAGSIYQEARSNEQWEDFLRVQIANFKAENRGRESQEWYSSEIKILKAYPDFVRIWSDLDDATIDRYATMRPYKNHEAIQLPPWESSPHPTAVGYRIIALPVLSDERFRLRIVVDATSDVTDTRVLQLAGDRSLTTR